VRGGLDKELQDFNDIETLAADKRREQDFADLQHEISGIEVGRIRRFLSAEAFDVAQGRQNGKAGSSKLSALDVMLLNDPVYAALYNETYSMLENAEAATERALMKAEQALEQAQEDHDQLMDNAAELPDGTKVFRDADGNVWTADGKQVQGDALNSIQWKGNEPSYQDYLNSKDKLDAANKSVFDLRHYQVDVLGRVRDDMTDPDNPPSADDLNRYKDQMKSGMPPAVKRELSSDMEQPQPTPTVPQAIAVPSLD